MNIADWRESAMEYGLDGYCGLYCGACPMLLETRAGTAKAACHGCKTDQNPRWCADCGLKACARGKGLDFCYACADYPCKDLEGFQTSAEYPYHREVYDYMKIIEKEGKDAWLEKMKARWSCPACAQDSSWWDVSCKKCGAGLNGYIKPDSE
jgi:hypothetical protein